MKYSRVFAEIELKSLTALKKKAEDVLLVISFKNCQRFLLNDRLAPSPIYVCEILRTPLIAADKIACKINYFNQSERPCFPLINLKCGEFVMKQSVNDVPNESDKSFEI